MARSRSRTNYTQRSGKKKRWINGTLLVNESQSGSFLYETATCTDDLGKAIPHNLTIIRTSKEVQPLNGSYTSSPGNSKEYSGWYVDAAYGAVTSHPSNLNPPSDGTLTSQAMARTNPSRAFVSLPTFVGEMKDLPRLIRQAGHVALIVAGKRRRAPKDILEEVANGNLTWQFGIAPVISDVKKILDFSARVDKRCEELNRLYSKGGLKRRITLFHESSSVPGSNVTIDSSLGDLVICSRTTNSFTKSWATLRWVPTERPSFNNNKQLRALATQLVFGMNAQSLTATAWELIPWSWLIDYFANVQSFIEAHNNAVPARAENVCLMRHRKTETVYTRTGNSASWVSGGGGSCAYETKVRIVGASPSINASLPLLSGRQLSILGSLAVTRYKGGR